MSTLAALVMPLIEDAHRRHQRDGRRGASWTVHHMTAIERELFDQWLAEIDHPLAHIAGTAEQRFLRLVDSLAADDCKRGLTA